MERRRNRQHFSVWGGPFFPAFLIKMVSWFLVQGGPKPLFFAEFLKTPEVAGRGGECVRVRVVKIRRPYFFSNARTGGRAGHSCGRGGTYITRGPGIISPERPAEFIPSPLSPESTSYFNGRTVMGGARAVNSTSC